MSLPNPLPIAPLKLPFDVSLTMPGSKSHVNRALVCAALSEGETTITGVTPFDDVIHMVNGLQTLGFDVQWSNENKSEITVEGCGSTLPDPDPNPDPIFCGNAGTAVRFLTSLACIVPGDWIITGDEHMQKRPIQPLIDALRELGVEIEAENNCPPIHIKGGTLTESETILDATKSSQYLTSLLLIAPALPSGLTINLTEAPTSPSYIDLTEKVMSDFGVAMIRKDAPAVRLNKSAPISYSVEASNYKAQSQYAIEGDWSAATSFLVLAEATNSRVRFTNLNPDSLQGDRKIPEAIRKMRELGDLTIDCTDFPDQMMNLCVLAAKRESPTHFRGAANLRLKECDRIGVTVEELSKAGIDITEHEDGVDINTRLQPTGSGSGSDPKCKPDPDPDPIPRNKRIANDPVLLNPHQDHRMAFCYATLGSLTGGISIQDPECVSKTYPHFYDDLQKLHENARCIAIVGMRASGKSRFGKRLAPKIGMQFIDTDTVFVSAHGDIGTYVEQNGWEAFRAEEERIIAESLRSGHVVSLGGGAIESEKTQKLLDREALVIWIHATVDGTVERLQKAKRPPLTDLPLEEEVRTVLQKRDPLYQSVADFVIDESTPYKKHISSALQALSDSCSL